MRVPVFIAALLLGSCSTISAPEPGKEGPAPDQPALQAVIPAGPASQLLAKTGLNGAQESLQSHYKVLDEPLPFGGNGVALPAHDTVLTRIDFGSCSATFKPLTILSTIAKDKPELFLYIGDNVYGDARRVNADLPELREAYGQLAADAHFQELRNSVPFMVTWDDHDFGFNDVGGDFAFKSYSQAIYRNFWAIPADDPRRERDGVYYAKSFGVDGKRVQFIVLDTRFFRSSPLKPTDAYGAKGRERYLPIEDPDMTILGDAQWKWLAEQLQQPADLRFIVSSIQVLAMDHGWEAWKEMMPQREKLFETIRNSGQKGVLLLSGDRHIATFYKQEGDVDYPLYEFTSSALNMSFTKNATEYDSTQLVKAFGPNNFGSIDIDWTNRNVKWRIRDEAGATQREMMIQFSEIGL